MPLLQPALFDVSHLAPLSSSVRKSLVGLNQQQQRSLPLPRLLPSGGVNGAPAICSSSFPEPFTLHFCSIALVSRRVSPRRVGGDPSPIIVRFGASAGFIPTTQKTARAAVQSFLVSSRQSLEPLPQTLSCCCKNPKVKPRSSVARFFWLEFRTIWKTSDLVKYQLINQPIKQAINQVSHSRMHRTVQGWRAPTEMLQFKIFQLSLPNSIPKKLNPSICEPIIIWHQDPKSLAVGSHIIEA